MNKFFLVLSTVVLAALAGSLAWLVVYTEQLSTAGELLEWTQFYGRFHPVILHLPIGLFVGLIVLELLAFRKASDGLGRSAHILVWLMAFTSVLTAFVGLLLASSGDYSGDTLWWHKWLGVVFCVAALIVTFFKVLSLTFDGKGLVLYRLLLLGLLVLLPVVGHNGGELTHGKGYLTKYAPEWLQGVVAEEEAVGGSEVAVEVSTEGNLFTQQVQPILEQYCVDCHGPEKQKSKYRLDTYEYLMTPGKMGDTPIEPNSMSESFVLEYMLLPEVDDMAMPPEGKPRPSAEEILLIAHWIANGAEGPPVDEAALEAERAAAEAEQAKVIELFDAGIIMLPIGKDSDLLYLDFQNVGDNVISNDSLEALSSYKDRVFEIKLNGIENAVSLLERFEGAPELRVLDVNGLKGADAAVSVLNSFNNLETLKLFGSDLSGAGLSQLSLSALDNLYIGTTQVTAEQIDAFRKANVSTQVFGDVDLASIDAIISEDLANSAEFNPNDKK
ncbi:MAG: c-type cytochrome domain-containing protein [Coraliomargarita sp.]